MSDEKPSFLVFRAYLLRREFTWFDVFLWVIANPLASGLLYYSVAATGYPGFYGGVMPFAFLLAGIVFIPVALLFMIIASSLPRSAAPYVFTSRSLGILPGFLAIGLYLFISGGLLSLGFLAYSSLRFLSSGLYLSGYMSGNTASTEAGLYLGTPVYALILTIITLTVLLIIGHLGRRAVRIVLYATVTVPLILLILIVSLSYPFSNNVFTSNWNTLFNNSYREIINTALKGGAGVEPLRPVDAWTGILGLFTIAVWAYLGVESASFIAGEVRDPVKSYLKGYIAGYSVLVALYTVMPVVVTLIAGYDFLASYSYLYHYYPRLLGALMGVETPPSPSILLVIGVYNGNPVVALTLAFTAYLFYFNTMLTTWVAATRILFSLSEDHLMPRLFTRVSRKTHTPHYSNAFIYLLSIIVASATTYIVTDPQLESSFIKIMSFGYTVFLTVTGLAMLAAPVVSERLYSRLTYRNRALLYTIGFISSVAGFGLTLTTWSGISLGDILVTTVGYTVLLLVFIVITTYMKHRGVRYEEVFSKIPPM